MRTTIDAAGRMVIPKRLRMDIGMLPGEVEVEIDGAGIRITPIVSVTDVDQLDREDGRWVLPEGPASEWTAEQWREFRLADQR
jgi:AbrB family looped-hinge helix DNA binding protein